MLSRLRGRNIITFGCKREHNLPVYIETISTGLKVQVLKHYMAVRRNDSRKKKVPHTMTTGVEIKNFADSHVDRPEKALILALKLFLIEYLDIQR